MKHRFLTAFAIAAALFAGCAKQVNTERADSTEAADTAAPSAAQVGASSMLDRQWKLVEIKTKTSKIVIDRAKLAKDGSASYFTITFGKAAMYGAGAPNRYTADYKSAENQKISIGEIAATKAFAFREPKELTENSYFNYLRYVSEWRVSGNRLELITPDASLFFTAD